MSASPKSSNNPLNQDFMPDNPFLPDTLFENQGEKIKVHVGLFLGIVAGLRLVRMLAGGNLSPPTTTPSTCISRR